MPPLRKSQRKAKIEEKVQEIQAQRVYVGIPAFLVFSSLIKLARMGPQRSQFMNKAHIERARRNPIRLKRKSGPSRKRYATRQNCGKSNQAPPRRTRVAPCDGPVGLV